MDDYALLADEEARQRQNSTAATPDDTYDSLAAQEVNSRKSALTASLRQAVPVNPDQQANVVNLSSATGIPADVVSRNEAAIAEQARVRELLTLAQDSPILAAQLTDPSFAKLAHADAENLGTIEQRITKNLVSFSKWLSEDLPNVPGKNLAAVGASAHEMAGGLWGYGMEMPADLASKYLTKPLFGEYDPIGPLAQFARKQRQSEQAVASAMDQYWGLNEKGSYLANMYYGALKSVWQSLSTAGVGALAAVEGKAATQLTGNLLQRTIMAGQEMPLAALLPMMASQGGQTYGKDVDAGVNPLVAAGHATSDAMIEGLTEQIGLGRFVHDIRVGDPIWKVIRNQLLTENVGEQVATHMEDLNAWAIHPENKDKTFGDYLAERPGAALDTMIQTTMATIMQTGVMGLASTHLHRDLQAENAARHGLALKDLLELAAKDPTRTRAPADFAAFVQNVADQGDTPTVWIDGATFAQAAADKIDIAALMPETAKQLAEAIQNKTDIEIPLGELTAAIPGTGLENTLLQDMRTTIDGPTMREAADQKWAEDTKATVEKIINQQEFDTAIKASAATVEGEILAQLKTVNRFTDDVNTPYAKLAAAYYTVQAAHMGITPEELYVQHPLAITAEGLTGGNVMEQAGRSETYKVFRGENPSGPNDSGVAGKGAYHSGRRQVAEAYAGKDGRVAESTITLRNPLKLTYSELNALQTKLYGKPLTGFEPALSGQFDAYLRSQGHDGVVLFDHEISKTVPEEVVQLAPDSNIPPGVYNQSGKAKHDNYTLDLFDVPADRGANSAARGPTAGRKRTRAQLSRNDAPGTYATRTELVQENTRQLGTNKVTTPEEAAQALAYLGKAAVERFDALVTDKKGKPLAIVGAFKGAMTQTGVYPATIVAEAFRINGAAHIWMAHNHPSGTAEFSAADRNINSTLYEAFRGSTIKMHGLFAIAGKQGEGRHWIYQEDRNSSDVRGVTNAPSSTGSSVPVVERVFAAEDALGPPISAPSAAKDAAKNLAGGESGAVLMSAQNVPIAFVPIDPAVAGELRVNGRMDALYRALSLANAAAAIIVNNGNMPETTVNNLAGLFSSMDARVLDVMDTSDPGKVTSWAELGKGFGGSTFRQNARGTYNPETSTIALLNGADLSTFLHELGHHFLEMTAALASQPDAPAAIRADMDQLLQWFGVDSLDTWHNLSFEEKRSYHEQFARGFESYLFEGKAPSIELLGVFGRFRAWLINVYRQLANLKVTLTDEVRGVMDRMIATNDEILAAESTRGYAPLFKSAEEMGATPAEWIAYQAQNQEGTQEAVDQLQTRSLRDMRWITNTRAKVMKKLQAEANVKRREVRMDVRREVWSMPVYQAWQFLTARENLYPGEPKEKTSASVDESRDSLFVAIAKLGGINRDELVSEWGIEKTEKTEVNIFGKPVIRAKGGLSIDGMAELLSQYGYLELNEHGQHDLHDFEDKFFSELGGSPSYSIAYDYGRDQADDEGRVAAVRPYHGGRLNTEIVRVISSPEIAAKLESLRMTKLDGISPDLLVEAFPAWGFTSGDELVRTLAEAQPPSVVIEGMTDQRMLERYGDLSSPDAISRAADAAIHNDARGRFIATELNALQKAVSVREDTGRVDKKGRPISVAVLPRAAKAFAAMIIARKKIREVRPNQYTTAEARAGRAAERATSLTEKVTEKRNQLVNHYAARAAYEALDYVERQVAYLKTVGTRDSIDIGYREQIDAMLERFDLRQLTNKEAAKRANLADWIKAQEDAGYDTAISEDMKNEAFRKPYREMTVEEFRGLVDSIKNIEHLGRLKKKLLTAADQREFDTAVAEITTTIEENAKKTLPEQRASDRGFLVTMRTLFREAAAMHRKFASLVRGFDGFKDGGIAWGYLVRNMNERGNFEAVENEKATIALTKLLSPVMKGGKLTEKQFFPGIGKSFSREERIGIALNMGNEINRERVLTGERLSPAQLDQILNTLTREDWQFVQGVWDYFESFRPQIAEKERRISGVEPEWVEAAPVHTQWGDYRGGYYPIAYDPIRSERSGADVNAEVARQIQQGLYARAQTRRGHLKERVESTGRPLRYDFGEVITRHVTQVVHDLAWHEYLIDANRLLRAPAVENAVRAHYGVEVLKELKDTLRDIAIGTLGAEKGAKFWNHLRYGTTIVGLGYNVFNTLQNLTGITQSFSRIGTSWVLKGAMHWLGDAVQFEGSVAQIHAKSDFMRMRAKTMQREINDIRNKVSGKDSKIEASYFWLQNKTQQMVDVPTWWGAYEKAMAEDDMTENKAAALADQAVLDAQGSGQIKDLAGIQRGGAGMKLFTTFYSFFNTTFNNTAEAYGRTDFKKPGQVALFAADMVLLYTIPALLTTLLKAALMGDWDDEEKLAKKLIGDQISYLLGTVIGLREAAAGVQAAAGVGEGFGYTGPASVRFFSDLYNLGKQINQGEADEAFWKALDNVGGVLFHYPAGQINRTASGIAALSDGRTQNPLALVMGAPKK